MESYLAEIECLTCYNKITVKVKKGFDGWFTVVCPKCNCLAYNSKTPPPKKKEEE